MYDFTNLDELPQNRDNSIQTILNGVNLDTNLQGFTTLNVHGRELISRKVSTVDFEKSSNRTTKGTGGSARTTNKFLGSGLVTRTITVEYMINAETNSSFRQIFEMFNFYIHNEEMDITFTDDINYKYIGTLGDVEQVDASQNNVIGSFTLICANPYKISTYERKFNFTNTGKFNFYTLYSPNFTNIEIKVKTGTDVLKLTNTTTGLVIILNNNFSKGDIVKINLEDNKITRNGINIFDKLALISDLEDFTANFNEELIVNTNADVEITFKEVRL